ncbi:6,7-dimethyl-8-ribityllumazine synthase [Candidatus Blochmanniella vafra str. BVAF]|uniref:6,7-dimethyl-8-ribityllumazine synthase n=1 Tax=Blochmanniella vafra (strain BVAF) TaxID=859654 RepID=E8Q618_BLOVB|nr:6,7-dimethyl-8-ribityllumazine synthase [Candidatus Blochmannia vafer]ADV33634.1 6,7-dimethyl-8-ribityllumazine synthase [Candidatus Blochmannia vafer str. BVAF]
MNVIESNNVVTNAVKIAIVVARFNRFINNNLLDGAIDVLRRIGCVKDQNITVVWVPGAYELSLAIKALAITNSIRNNNKNKNNYDALIALGTIIRGETEHFHFISRSCSAQLTKISIDNILPIGLGLLVTNNVKQAVERAGIKDKNKGAEAALAVLEMINILKLLNY